MSKLINLEGKKFGKWTVIARAPNRENKTYWLCCCECGNKNEVDSTQLRGGVSTRCKSCHKKTHGMYGTKAYRVWSTMKNRCLNPNNKNYKDYGGRGITVCERWMTFENFYADMGDPPNGLWLDRVDNDGNYELSNCKWTTPKIQQNNRKRRTKFPIEAFLSLPG